MQVQEHAVYHHYDHSPMVFLTCCKAKLYKSGDGRNLGVFPVALSLLQRRCVGRGGAVSVEVHEYAHVSRFQPQSESV